MQKIVELIGNNETIQLILTVNALLGTGLFAIIGFLYNFYRKSKNTISGISKENKLLSKALQSKSHRLVDLEKSNAKCTDLIETLETDLANMRRVLPSNHSVRHDLIHILTNATYFLKDISKVSIAPGANEDELRKMIILSRFFDHSRYLLSSDGEFYDSSCFLSKMMFLSGIFRKYWANFGNEVVRTDPISQEIYEYPEIHEKEAEKDIAALFSVLAKSKPDGLELADYVYAILIYMAANADKISSVENANRTIDFQGFVRREVIQITSLDPLDINNVKLLHDRFPNLIGTYVILWEAQGVTLPKWISIEKNLIVDCELIFPDLKTAIEASLS